MYRLPVCLPSLPVAFGLPLIFNVRMRMDRNDCFFRRSSFLHDSCYGCGGSLRVPSGRRRGGLRALPLCRAPFFGKNYSRKTPQLHFECERFATKTHYMNLGPFDFDFDIYIRDFQDFDFQILIVYLLFNLSEIRPSMCSTRTPRLNHFPVPNCPANVMAGAMEISFPV